MRVALRRLFRIANPPVGAMNPDARLRGWGRRFKIMMRHTWLMHHGGVLLCGGLGAVAYHIATQPTELTIAVGPANSEDTRVVQSIAAQFAREQSNIRLQTKIVDGGPPAAAAAIDNGQADLAVVRRDSGMPKNGQAVAILRKNVVVFIVPSAAEPAKGAKGKAAAKAACKEGSRPMRRRVDKIEKLDQLVGKRLGVVGRSPRNIDLLKVILRQYRISPDQFVMLSPDDLDKPNEAGKIGVIQFDPNNVASAIKDSNADVIMSVGPVGSPITADAIAAATRGKEAPTFIAIDASEAIAEREPVYESGEIKAGAFGGSPQRPEEDVETIEVQSLHRRAEKSRRAGRRRLHQASVCHPAEPRRRIAVRRQDRKTGHRQGCGCARASRRRRLSRRRVEDVLRPLQRPALLGPDGDVGARLWVRRPVELQQGGRPRPQAPRARAAAGDCQVGPQRRIRSRRWTTCRRRSTPSRPA